MRYPRQLVLTGQPSWHSMLHCNQSTPTSAVWNRSGIAFSEITACSFGSASGRAQYGGSRELVARRVAAARCYRPRARRVKDAGGRGTAGYPKKKASMIRRVMGAAKSPPFPSGTVTTTVATAMLGSVIGAKAGNQASGSGPPVSAVPLFPAAAIGNPRKERYAVPNGEVMTARMVVTTKSMTGLLSPMAWWTVGLLAYAVMPPGRTAFSTRRGSQRVPRLPQAA